MKISTKRGNDGCTSTVTGLRVSKDNAVIEYVGTVDELQSFLGTLNHKDIEEIQRDLYKLMAGQGVDIWFDTTIEPQREFILPRSKFHVARSICRRAERRGVSAGVDIKYLNRLSDYLYKIALKDESETFTQSTSG